MRLGLVLGGGGVRGAAHIGVIQELEEMGLRPAALAGTSSGGLVAALYAAGADVNELAALARSLTWRSAIGGLFPWRRSRPALMALLDRYLGEARFEALPLRLAISAFDPLAQATVTFRSGPVLPAVRATIALPGLFAPSRSEDRRILVDGGLTKCLPTDAVQDVDAIVAVDVRPRRPDQPPPRRPKRFWIYQQAYEVLHRTQTELDLQRAHLVLTPEVGDVGTLDFASIDRCIEAGRKAVQESREAIAALRDLPKNF